jgi:hypothetical protein
MDFIESELFDFDVGGTANGSGYHKPNVRLTHRQVKPCRSRREAGAVLTSRAMSDMSRPAAAYTRFPFPGDTRG